MTLVSFLQVYVSWKNMEEERNDSKTKLLTLRSWEQELIVLWKPNSLLLINVGQWWLRGWDYWSRCSLWVTHAVTRDKKKMFIPAICYFKSTTNCTLKVYLLLENGHQEFPTLSRAPFHPWTEIIIFQTSLPILNLLFLNSDLCTHGQRQGLRPYRQCCHRDLHCPCHCHPVFGGYQNQTTLVTSQVFTWVT